MSVYNPLISYLMTITDSRVVLSFQQIENILKRHLPDSAKKYPAFWARGNYLGNRLIIIGWQASPRFRLSQVEFHRLGMVNQQRKVTTSHTETNALQPDLIFIGCVKEKLPGSHPANDLYISTLFRGRADYARFTGKPWFILSAKYKLIKPDDVITTYDLSLKNLTAHERRSWSQKVLQQIDTDIGSLEGKFVEIHAGVEYRDFGLVQGLKERGATVNVPLAHLGLGKQLNWYKTHNSCTSQNVMIEKFATGHQGSTRPKHQKLNPVRPITGAPVSAARVMEIIEQLTTEFMDNGFDLSKRRGVPSCGWEGIPEVHLSAKLRRQHVSASKLRMILTLGVTMDRARNADRLWDYIFRLYQSAPWAYDPETLKSVDMNTLRQALKETGVSQRHGPDSRAWQRVGMAMVDPDSPQAFRDVIFRGSAHYSELIQGLHAISPDGQPWFPLLSGPKISLVWLRMMAEPGGARIEGMEHIPVAVDVQVRKTSEYLGVTQTYGLGLSKARQVIQIAWQSQVAAARGPGQLAGTGAALDPAIWFFGKWGCTYCERQGRKNPISTLCNDCRFDNLY